jgi:hypothetical protein
VCESSLDACYSEDDNIISSTEDRQSNFDLLREAQAISQPELS